MAELINKLDSLNTGREKINQSIQDAEDAKNTAQTAETTANQALSNSESTQTQLDTIVIEGDSSVEAAQARVKEDGTTFDTLRDRLNNSDMQLAQEEERTTENKRAVGYYWIPEMQPPARGDEDNHFADGFSITPQQFIDDLMEPLRLADTTYSFRENMGKDQSGQYDIWRYQFRPSNYKQTIIIDSLMHGGEITCALVMVRFLHYLVNEWEKYPELAYIRENVRVIYTPIVNPWGMADRQAGLSNGRKNSRGVDLNRNFPYLWDEFSSVEGDLDYKGPSPLSELESQYVNQTLEKYPDAVAYLNLHNTGSPDADVYVPYAQNMEPTAYENLIDYWVRNIVNPVLNFFETDKPSAPNYAYNMIGIKASGPEWCDRRTGGGTWSSKDITDALEWFSNVIIEHLRDYKAESILVREQYYSDFGGTGVALTDQTFMVELTDFKDLVYIPADGIAVYDGSVTLQLVSGSGICEILPLLGQSGNGTGDWYGTEHQERWRVSATLNETLSHTTIPFHASIPVKKTNGISVVNAGFGLKGRAAGFTATIVEYRGRFTFYPTNIDNIKTRQITINE